MSSPANKADDNARAKAENSGPDSASHKALTRMFWFATCMAALCLVAAVAWLIIYQIVVFREGHDVMVAAPDTYYPDFVLKNQMLALFIQSAPSSCGTLAGIGLAFLGFAIVCLDLKATIGVEGQYDKAHLKFMHLSPGILTIIVAAVLIGFSISRYHRFEPRVFENWTQK